MDLAGNEIDRALKIVSQSEIVKAGSGKKKKHHKPMRTVFSEEELSYKLTKGDVHEHGGSFKPYSDEFSLSTAIKAVRYKGKAVSSDFANKDPFFKIKLKEKKIVDLREITKQVFDQSFYYQHCLNDKTANYFADIPTFPNIELATLSTPPIARYKKRKRGRSLSDYYNYYFSEDIPSLSILFKQKNTFSDRYSLFIPLILKDEMQYDFYRTFTDKAKQAYDQAFGHIFAIHHYQDNWKFAYLEYSYYNGYFTPESFQNGLVQAIKSEGGTRKSFRKKNY